LKQGGYVAVGPDGKRHLYGGSGKPY
jgi:hypothetical protein